jgi:transcriptional regulator with XRE-family HTH domain
MQSRDDTAIERIALRPAEAARAIGVDRRTISRWENCATYPDSLIRMHLNDLARLEGYDAVPRRYGH